MKTVNTLDNIPDDCKNCVIAIGNFDGIHRGHQALLEKARHVAKEKNLQLGVLTFEPPSKTFVSA